MCAIIMDEIILQNVGITEDELQRIELTGSRSVNGWLNSWLGIKNLKKGKLLVVDNMTGEMSLEGICMLIEMLSEYCFYKENKIAVVLNDNNSYNSRFFDLFAKYWGISAKHFVDENEAVEWLAE
jgi:hypothetical protein